MKGKYSYLRPYLKVCPNANIWVNGLCVRCYNFNFFSAVSKRQLSTCHTGKNQARKSVNFSVGSSSFLLFSPLKNNRRNKILLLVIPMKNLEPKIMFPRTMTVSVSVKISHSVFVTGCILGPALEVSLLWTQKY